MPTNKPIQSVVVTSAVSSITFSGIDQSYTDLLITANFTLSTANASVFMRFNEDTTTAYSDTSISGTGSALWTDRDSNATQIRVSAQRTAQTATDRQTFTININDYNNTTNYKTCLSRYGSVGGVEAFAGQWRKTAAINSITFGFGSSYTFSPGTTISLYGIKSGGSPQALGGDQVTTDGTYWYHTFRTTQAFIPYKALTVDYLVVAGGGAACLAGGGAGGVRSTVTATGGGGSLESPISLALQPYTITVGAGGATIVNAIGVNGNNSTLATITSTGGGGGNSEGDGVAGGSGGGGGTGAPAATRAGGAASPSGQGYAGGGTNSGRNRASGGGGGAGAVGNTNSLEQTGAGGGAGITVFGLAIGGGGGGGGRAAYVNGAGINFGGGSGGTYTGGAEAATNGTANTGGGGGGGWETNRNGGSGLVIVRYPV